MEIRGRPKNDFKKNGMRKEKNKEKEKKKEVERP